MRKLTGYNLKLVCAESSTLRIDGQTVHAGVRMYRRTDKQLHGLTYRTKDRQTDRSGRQMGGQTDAWANVWDNRLMERLCMQMDRWKGQTDRCMGHLEGEQTDRQIRQVDGQVGSLA